MRYTSTRDSSVDVIFEEALINGYSKDGGLYVPSVLPFIDHETLRSWIHLSYSSLASTVLRLFISREEICDHDLDEICTAAFSKCFNDSDIEPIPIRKVGSVNIAELFHGPTFCFKDFGLRCLIFFLSYFSTRRNRKLILLVSTTGDTGPAAVNAVSEAANPRISILAHYPDGQISTFQRKQMTTIQSPHVSIASFEGGGDDMDEPIKQMLNISSTSSEQQTLCGINSYNIGRPLAQMIHFIWIYLRYMEAINPHLEHDLETLDFILPTGAMGNIAGGYMAKKMGIPIGYLCACVNVNDITHRVIETGQFHKSPTMIKTLSEAINIQIPYNFERILFYLTHQDSAQVKIWMDQMSQTMEIDLDSMWHVKLCTDFRSSRVTDKEMCETIKDFYLQHNYFADPHTAVALKGAEILGYFGNDSSQDNVHSIILATASPCKFQEAVTAALGHEVWESYFEYKLPARAKAIYLTEEVEPHHYRNNSKELYERQSDWMKQALEIIKKF